MTLQSVAGNNYSQLCFVISTSFITFPQTIRMEVAAYSPAQVRRYLSAELKIESWEDIDHYYRDLKNREINSTDELKAWLRDRNELEAAAWEEECRRMIAMNCNTEDENLKERFEFFMNKIKPNILSYTNIFNRKLLDNPYHDELNPDKYGIFLRGISKQAEIFRENNVPLITKLESMGKDYDAIIGEMTIKINGEEITLPRAQSMLQSTDRELRKEVFLKREERFLQDDQKLENLYSEMLAIRQQIALNAGFANYRDYKFASLERFDYTPEDCFNFNESIRQHMMPIITGFDQNRKNSLGVEKLKPWDLWVDEMQRPSLKPFETADELIEKTIEVMDRVRPKYGDFMLEMRERNCFDLDSRTGKAPGGYNCPMHESRLPFIFMNATGFDDDIRTITHEMGHAIHCFLTWHLNLIHSRQVPGEIAELASMSMELFSMDHWNIYYPDEHDLKRAQMDQLERSLRMLTRIAPIDKFQHWVHENPNHSLQERNEAWLKIFNEFTSAVIDFRDVEKYRKFSRQIVLHLFKLPFYFIEYGFARLGSIALWRNYKQDKEKTLDAYEKALSLGYTRSLPELYEAAGIKFDFSEGYISELAHFVKEELDKLN